MNTERIWTLLSRKLSGEATQTELSEMDELLEVCPENQLPIQFTEYYWNIPTEQDEEYMEATFQLHCDRMKARGFEIEDDYAEAGSMNLENDSKKRHFRLFLFSGLTLATVIALIFFSFFYKSSNPIAEKMAQSEVSTKNGSRTKIQLPDGTAVWLNSNSKLVYDNKHFGTNIREVTLTGEAYFDVVKNLAKPFVIHTTKMDIKVLGTAFNVKCYPNDKNIETSLIRGSIEVTLKDRQEKIIMKPNEKLILSNDELKAAISNIPTVRPLASKASPVFELGHVTISSKDNSVVESAWVYNKLAFEDESISEVALKMERWYNVKIIVLDENLNKYKIGGTFVNESLEQALKGLQFLVPFNYTIKDNEVKIIKK